MLKVLLAVTTAVPLAAGLAGTGLAEGGGTRIVTSSSEYTRCIASGGEEFYEEGDDITICRYTSGHWEGSEIWCDADLSDCEFVSVPPSANPGPAGQASTGAPSTGTAAPAAGGSAGPAAISGGMLQLEIQR